MKTIKMLALAATATLALATPAMAATITYKLSGSFSGINGGPFTNVDAVFTGVADTANRATLDGVTVTALSSFSALAGGLTYNFTTPMIFFVYSDADFSGFADFDGSAFVRFTSTSGTGFTGYNGFSNLAPTPATFFTDDFTGSFATDRGDILVTGASDLALSASVAGAVPEPATWAMMIGGMGVVGGAMRRRRSLKTNISFA